MKYLFNLENFLYKIDVKFKGIETSILDNYFI